MGGNLCKYHIYYWYSGINIYEGMAQTRDPLAVWDALVAGHTEEIGELATLAIKILKIVVNQAGMERTFSLLKIVQTAL